jgi:4-hydroxy-tetrahydrodipicolinate reductase
MELHHKEKKDAPSGTAITLNKILNINYKKEIPVSSIRSGYIKGIHDIGFESEVDKINIRHEAYSREGFALGAVLAAEWIDNVNGCVEFRELFKTMINEQ